MKYLQKGPFSVAVSGGDNYDQTFGKKCFYCKQLLVPEEPYDWSAGVHKMCVTQYEKDTESEIVPTSDDQKSQIDPEHP